MKFRKNSTHELCVNNALGLGADCLHKVPLFISLIRMRSKRDIKMGRLCTPGGAVLGIVGGGCDVPFFKW